MASVSFPIAVSFPMEKPGWREWTGDQISLVSEYLAKPAHLASKPFIRAIFTTIRSDYPTLEKIKRVFIIALCIITAPITVGLFLVGGFLDLLVEGIKEKPFIHYVGDAKEIPQGEKTKLMSLNACSMWGGLPIPLGGVRPASERLDQIADLIKAQDPDILVMQEVSYGPALDLYGHLRENYAHFFTRIGPNPFRMESCLFAASKHPVLSSGWIPFPDQGGIFRGAFYIETEKCYIFTTHLEFGPTEESKQKRQDQIALIQKQMDEFSKKKPCYLSGDLNTEVGEAEELLQNFEGIHHLPTCTNELTKYMTGEDTGEPPSETDDYALIYGRGKTPPEMELVHTYDDNKPLEALSDHKAITSCLQSTVG